MINDMRLVKLVILLFVLQLCMIGYIVYSHHQEAVDRVHTSRKGCERNKLDRVASVTVNENIVKIFEASQKNVHQISSSERKEALGKIKHENVGLQARSQLNCNEVWTVPRWP